MNLTTAVILIIFLGIVATLFGNPPQLQIQLTAVAATSLYAFIATALILKALSYVSSLRVTEKEEKQGLDLAVHGESGYRF